MYSLIVVIPSIPLTPLRLAVGLAVCVVGAVVCAVRVKRGKR